MKKILSFLSLGAIAFAFAQGPRFTYDYRFIPDSTNRDSILTERVVLQITPTGSEFFGVPMYQSDSAMVAEAARGNAFAMPSSKVKFRDRVQKTKDQLYYFTQVSMDYFKVVENPDFNWKIQPEFSEILGYKTQKATTEFGGRKWTAWFTSEIPISDGPYKFRGLPGLIVKLEDHTNSHQFTLIGIKKTTNEFSYPDPRTRRLTITQDKYEKVFQNYRKHPEIGIAGNIPDQTDASGHFRRGADIEREWIQTIKKGMAKDNNILELNLLQGIAKTDQK